MPLQLAPFRSNGRKPRTLYPFLVVPLLALILVAGTLSLYLLNNAAKAAPANALTTFPGTVPALVGQSKLIGPANANQSISLSFGLRPRNADVLKSYTDSITKPKSANYHHFLTPVQAQSVFAPSKQVHDAILQYLRSSGFSITHTYKHRMTITFTGSIGSGSVIVAERPMYFIYSGTQGGTDVLGYTGQ